MKEAIVNIGGTIFLVLLVLVLNRMLHLVGSRLWTLLLKALGVED